MVTTASPTGPAVPSSGGHLGKASVVPVVSGTTGTAGPTVHSLNRSNCASVVH